MLQTCAAVLFLALSFSGCAVARYLAEPVTPDDFAQKISALAGPAGVVGSQVYLLEFDFDGRLNNPFEVAKAIAYIRERQGRNDPVKKIVILSFGWNHERSEAVDFYIKYLSEYIATVPDAREKLKQDVIFCISWDSNAGGFKRFVTDLIPAPALAETVSKPLDTLAFPLTFWTKAGLADRIGYGALRDVMETVLEATSEEGKPGPSIYLIGHSFGSRILNGLAQAPIRSIADEHGKARFLGLTMRRAQAFKYVDEIRGAVFIQPALSYLELPSQPDAMAPFPIVVTQSRHDHANGVLYPLANVALNTTFVSPGVDDPFLTTRLSRQSRLRRIFNDVIRVPVTVFQTLILTPFSYLGTQFGELYTRKADYIPDTMAHIPFVDVGIWWIDQRVFDGKRQWGARTKGLFNLGIQNESAGRASLRRSFPVSCFVARPEWKFTHPIIFLDATSAISQSSWGPDLNKPWVEFTVGWVDPIGSHSNIVPKRKNGQVPVVFDVVDRVLNGKVRPASSDEAPTDCDSDQGRELRADQSSMRSDGDFSLRAGASEPERR